MKTILKAFARRTDGQVTVLFALAAVPLLLAAGVAIDRIRMDNAQTEMQAAADGAAMAAALADSASNAQRKSIASDYFRKNFAEGARLSYNLDVTVNADNVIVTARAQQPTSFLRLAGIDTSPLAATADVMRSLGGNAEVAMVLDYSGSMNSSNKYTRMAAAATNMIQQLARGTRPGQVKLGLVPFSAMVRTSMPAAYVSQSSPTATWTGCTQDRDYPFNLTVDTPTSDPRSKWGFIDSGNGGENSGGYGCVGYENKNLTILPLTADLDMAKNKLQDMRPLGNTNIPLGAEFGWNLLDPQAPFTEAAPYSDSKTKKYLILLTDGVQTSRQSGRDGARTKQNGNQNLPLLCRNMAAKGISIFTIAYDVTDARVTDLLKECAGENYFEPDADGREIAQVFNAISREIRRGAIRIAR